MTDPVVHIQVDPMNSPSTPPWFGEVVVVAHALQQHGTLKAIQERVRLVRARMGKYELIDFVAMLIGYAVSGERTLQAFCERAQPFAAAFMALFGRADFPDPATLSRYLAVLDQPCVEALRTYFWRTCSPARRSAPHREDCGTAWACSGCSSMWMAPNKQLANARFQPPQTCLRLIAALTGSVLQGIWGASAGKWSERGPRFCKRTRTNGWARLATLATASIAPSSSRRAA